MSCFKGAKVVCITCDSPRVQLSMMRHLGSNMDPTSPDPQICRSKDGLSIFHIQDMCHAVKLVRNAWHKLKKIKNSKDEVIDWGYIEQLYVIQSNAGLKMANKLTSRHIDFQNNIMKVKYAVQLLSRSVALSLKECKLEPKSFFQDLISVHIHDVLMTSVLYVNGRHLRGRDVIELIREVSKCRTDRLVKLF